MICGGFGDARPVDDNVKSYANEVKGKVEEKLNTKFTVYEPINYKKCEGKCYKDDKRRTFHAKTYADQALRYFRKYHNDKAKAYLEQAKIWLSDELKENSWEYDLKSLYSRISETIINV